MLKLALKKVVVAEREFSGASREVAVKILKEFAELIVKDAQDSMKQAPAPGVPSRRGTPPNVQSGTLKGSGKVKVFYGNQYTGTPRVTAGFDTPYALAQEKGYPPGNLPKRPYLGPAERRMRSKLAAIKRKHKISNTRGAAQAKQKVMSQLFGSVGIGSSSNPSRGSLGRMLLQTVSQNVRDIAETTQQTIDA